MNAVVFAVLLSIVCADAPDRELSKQVQTAVKTYQDSLMTAKRTFDRSAANAHASYLVALQKALTLETKAGRLDSAIAVRDIYDAAKSSGSPKVSLGFADSGKIDLAKLVRGFGRIQSMTLAPTVLRESDAKDGWQAVPDVLKRVRAVAYVGNGRDGGVADFTVVKSGTVMVICDYSYQGNASGNWTESRWTKEQFVANGWVEVTRDQLGGVLVYGNGVEQVVFSKQLNRGERMRLRCNKYRAPIVLILY
ncbi:MAG: hypothetical protein ABIH23_18980 [bacterium]